MERTIKVVAQKADPQAEIVKGQRGFSTTVINVMEDGTERPYRITCNRKRDLLADLQKLPIDNVKGMEVDADRGYVSFELFAYNGV